MRCMATSTPSGVPRGGRHVLRAVAGEPHRRQNGLIFAGMVMAMRMVASGLVEGRC